MLTDYIPQLRQTWRWLRQQTANSRVTGGRGTIVTIFLGIQAENPAALCCRIVPVFQATIQDALKPSNKRKKAGESTSLLNRRLTIQESVTLCSFFETV